MAQRLLIVGAGMACAYLLRQLDQQRHSYAITVVGDEAEACYNRVLLSRLLAGESTATDLAMLAATASSERLDFVTSCRVVSVDLARRCLYTDDGRKLGYDRLVFATGAAPVLPSLPGMDAPNIGVFRSLADAGSLSDFSGPGKRALVVGAGLLGLEAAHGLAQRGCDVMVLHRRDRIMNRQLDQRGSQQLQRALERQGIRFLLDDAIAELITAGNKLGGVLLQSHKRIATDRLIFATGIVPSIDVASAAGIRCEAGIVVDSYMRTSVPQVYALGECCQYRRQHFGLVAPIQQQAEVLCRELLAIAGAGFYNRKYPTQLKVSGVEVYSAGSFDSADDEENLVFQDSLAGVYRRLVVRDARLTGAVLVGDKRGGNWYDELIRSGTDISAIRSHLMFGKEMSNTPQPGRQAA
jgi:NAD(P)H-nitrite reductase large subunit